MSKNNSNKNNSKTNKKSRGFVTNLAISVGVGVVLGAIGFFSGYLIKYIENSDIMFDVFGNTNIYNNAVSAMPWIFACLSLIAGGINLMYYFKSKKAFNSWDGEDEESIFKIEQMISKVLIISNATLLSTFFLITIAIFFLDSKNVTLANKIIGINGGITLAIFTISTLFYMLIQRACIELEKKINPEKRGEVFDKNFQKDWDNSLDEAEKIMVGKAAYKSFKITNATCAIVWCIAFIAQIIYHTGVFTVLLITVIWIVSTLSYQIEAYKLENKNNKK
ncbi:MAG: DUF3169 family protein [Acutalibacteraceae bacterium]|nr:DUF3169 family protein [Acutalibacteraceae bacterium]